MTLVTSLYVVWGLYIVLGLFKAHYQQSRNCCRYSRDASEEEQQKASNKAASMEYWSSMICSLDWACGIIGAVLTLIYLFKG